MGVSIISPISSTMNCMQKRLCPWSKVLAQPCSTKVKPTNDGIEDPPEVNSIPIDRKVQHEFK